MRTPFPPDSHYLWLGRVVAACSILEVQLGMVGRAAATGEAWTEDWFPVAGSWSKAEKLLNDGLKLMSPGLADEVRQLVYAAQPLRDERNSFAHATFILDPESKLASSPWLVRTTRNVERTLLTEENGAELVAAFNRLSKAASQLRVRVADDFQARSATGGT